MRNTMRLQLFLLLLSTFCLAPAGAQARFDAANAQAVITELGQKAAAEPGIPGLSIAVLQKGGDEPVTAAFGTACVENGTPMTPETRFKIASVTKVFTAALVHRLIEEGKVAYDTPIERFFPGFPNGRGITVRNLLEHSSGIVDMLSLPAVRENMTRIWSPEVLIAMAGEQPLLFRPGTQQAYSNTGFLMLAVICERIAGQTYGDLVRGMFVERLGMKSLVAGDDKTIVPHLSCGYATGSDGGLSLPMMASLAVAKGTGNLEAAPRDVVRLVNLDRVLKKNVFDTAELEPLVLPGGWKAPPGKAESNVRISQLDGCELFVIGSPKITLVGKLGSFPGFGTAYFYDRQTKIAVVVSVNNERAISRAITLGADILRALRGEGPGATAPARPSGAR
ncbi:MAG TPA: serine hydrolase domain-containing protein [Humidesulfovibrio sp.]|uniref:serine hydrolase domain-containing protein n=1 Tax=Humidesulfovibrio sp. TaxID=2910988 RepID=UPI002C9D56E9|nr:serine hydrolase domain-containing protein [Humidesulfovibrio sp.]HWR03455.1 serine hydrolase domain-containing protein [Humidesulfovibrio sp.]